MKKTLLLILFILTFSCKKKEDSKEIFTKKTTIINTGDTIEKDKSILNLKKEEAEQEKKRFQVIDKFSSKQVANGFTYILFCEKLGSGSIIIKNMKIYKKKRLIQKINIDTTEVDGEGFLADYDYNFDGENDLQIINWTGTVDETYSYFLFDKNTKTYKHCKEMDHIINVYTDDKNKQIISRFHIGPVCYITKKYKWKKGILTRISYEEEGCE